MKVENMAWNTKYYVGECDNGRLDLFAAENPKEATIEATGYVSVGCFDSKAEAQDYIDSE